MKKYFIITLLILVNIILLSTIVNAADVAILMSDYTKIWYSELSWDYEAEMNTICDTLNLAKISYIELTDEDLAQGNCGDAKVLILPNNCYMSQEQLSATRQFLNEGGTIFALMHASFKDITNTPQDSKLFQLGEEFGFTYEAFAWKSPLHGYVRQADDHPIFKGLPEYMRFHRNWAIVVRPAENTRVLAEWYNDDRMMPSHSSEINAAILENEAGNIIFVGEMIFMPASMKNPHIRILATNIVQYLLSKSTRDIR